MYNAAASQVTATDLPYFSPYFDDLRTAVSCQGCIDLSSV